MLHTPPSMLVEVVLTRFFEALTLITQVGTFVWLAAIFVFVVPLASTKAKKSDKHGQRHPQETSDLFPSIESLSISNKHSETPVVNAFPRPCSTGLTTRLLPFKNAKGEIEWVFTDDVQPGQELEAFKANPETFKKASQDSKASKPEKHSDILSPVTSNSSNNESVSGKKNEPSMSPQINTPSSTSSEDHKEEDGDEEEPLEDGEGGSLVHQCPHCEAKFRMRGYLTRHLKKHMSQKAYQCPFIEMSIYKDENGNTHKCHPSGGFSRRDTYKTHLKTRHFKFPPGTPIKGRNQSPGNCSLCGDWFENAEIWSEIHVEGAECKYLPAGFKGKSRIKNKLKKQMARIMKEEKKFKRSKKGCGVEYMSLATGTPNVAITPVMSNPSQYEYDDSPTQSSCSSMGMQRSLHQEHFNRSLPHRAGFEHSPVSNANSAMTPSTNLEDYDDEFCLDTEQMSVSFSVALQAFSPHSQLGASMYSTTDYAVPNYQMPNEGLYSNFIR